jgi:hypothetical protein
MDEVDLNRALSSPKNVFGHPDKVLAEETLSPSQKREILLRWQAEAVSRGKPSSSQNRASDGTGESLRVLHQMAVKQEGPRHQVLTAYSLFRYTGPVPEEA